MVRARVGWQLLRSRSLVWRQKARGCMNPYRYAVPRLAPTPVNGKKNPLGFPDRWDV